MTSSRSSIIVLTTGTNDRLRYLDKLLWSLSRQTMRNFELILASEVLDKEMQDLLGRYFCPCENHRIMATGHWNRCKTANRAIRESKGDIIFLLEDDLILKESFIEELIKTFELGPMIGSAYSRCIWMYYEGLRSKKGLMGSIARLVNKLSIHESILPRLSRRVSSYLYEVPVFTMSVACRKEALYKAGLYNQNVEEPISGEDYDLALRVRKAGYRIVLNMNAVSFHLTRQVTKKRSRMWENPKCLQGVNESEVYFITRNRDLLGLHHVVLHVIYRLLESVTWGARTGSIKALIFGMIGAIRGLAKGLIK